MTDEKPSEECEHVGCHHQQPATLYLCVCHSTAQVECLKAAALDALDVFKHELDIEYEDKGGAMVWSNSLEALARARDEIRRRYG